MTSLRLAVLFAALTAVASAQLASTGNQIWQQGAGGIGDEAERNDFFGAALGAGDFNGDGWQDLVVGVPSENSNRGIVHVIYGAPSGLTGGGSQIFGQGSDGIQGDAASGDSFGLAVVAADFDRDGFDDLAVGAPGEEGARGVVNVIYGSPDGLTDEGNQSWTQNELDGGGRATNDQFGHSLAAGDFNGDTISDLAVGSPGEENFSGLVHVIYGTVNGLSADDNQRWRQDADNIEGNREDGDAFGSQLAAGDFNGDEFDDLAVAVPGEDGGEGQIQAIFGASGRMTSEGNQRWRPGDDELIGDAGSGDLFGERLASGDFNGDGFSDLAFASIVENGNAGEVIVMYGGNDGLSAEGAQRWGQGLEGLADMPEGGDRFGTSLATGDFNDDLFDDLAVGVRGEDGNIGIVQVLIGSASRLTATGSQLWRQGSNGIPGEGRSGEDFGDEIIAGNFGVDLASDLAISAPREDNDRGVVHVLYGAGGLPGAPRLTSAVGAGLSIPPVQLVSPNGLMSLFGENFAVPGFSRALSSGDLVNGEVPTNLDGVCVEINQRRAPVIGVFAPRERADQINVQASRVMSENIVRVQVILDCDGARETLTNVIEQASGPVAPEFFYFVLREDGVNPIAAQNAVTFSLIGPADLGVGFAPARAGDIVALYATGLGETSPPFVPGEIPNTLASTALPVRVTIGGADANVQYAGVAPGFAGLYQINIEIPSGLAVGPQPVVLTIGDVQPTSTPPGPFLAVQ